MEEKWFHKSVKEVIKTLNTDEEKGLSQEEVSKRYEKYGKNELKLNLKNLYL